MDLPVPHYSPGSQSSLEMALVLTIDFKDFPIVQILNLHCAIRVNYIDDERSNPFRTEFTCKYVQARAVQQYLLVRFKGLPYNVLVME